MPAIAIVVLGLVAVALASEMTVEPYPSITMPGFHQTAAIANPDDVGVRHLRLEYPGETATLGANDLFSSAPAGQQARMVKRLDRLTGTSEEWHWIDQLRPDQSTRASAAEVVLISRSGKELVLVRVERVS